MCVASFWVFWHHYNIHKFLRHCLVGISESVLQFCQNPTIGYILCTIWREHLLKISRELFFDNLAGIPFVPQKEGKVYKRGPKPPPFLWEKGAPANFKIPKILPSFPSIYRYGKYQENTEGFIPKYRDNISHLSYPEYNRKIEVS